MSTKKKILDTAKHLFNEYGVRTVTTNHIAKELNISPGNLYYHFHNKEEIIRAIYQEMLGKLAEIWDGLDNEEFTLRSFKKIVTIYNLLYDNRFFQYEIINLLESDTQLKVLYNQNRWIRYQSFKLVISKMIDKGLLVSYNQFDYSSLLTDQLWFTGDFWMTYTKSLNNEFNNNELKKLLLTQLSLFYRYATDKGRILINRLEKLIRNYQ